MAEPNDRSGKDGEGVEDVSTPSLYAAVKKVAIGLGEKFETLTPFEFYIAYVESVFDDEVAGNVLSLDDINKSILSGELGSPEAVERARYRASKEVRFTKGAEQSTPLQEDGPEEFEI